MESKQTSDQLCTMAHVEKPLAEKHLPTVLPQLPLNPRFRCSFCSRSIRYIYFFLMNARLKRVLMLIRLIRKTVIQEVELKITTDNALQCKDAVKTYCITIK
jgi:hypothetical protein